MTFPRFAAQGDVPKVRATEARVPYPLLPLSETAEILRHPAETERRELNVLKNYWLVKMNRK